MSFNEKLSYTEHVVTTPATDFGIGFKDYGADSDTIKVTVDDILATDAGYTVFRKNAMTIALEPAVTSGVVRLQRETNIDASFYRFTAGAKFVAANIDANFEQILHSQQETRDGFTKLASDVYPLVNGLEEALEKADSASKAAQEAAEAAAEAAQLTRSASQVFDASGLTQQDINDGVNTIADLLAIPTPKNGSRVYVKGYRPATNLALAQPFKGGGMFIYMQDKVAINNGITVFNGWVRVGINGFVTPEMAGAYADGINPDSDAFTIAIQYAHANNLQVHAMGATYYIHREVNILLGTSYGTQGTVLKGAGKAKTIIRFAANIDCFNLTNITQPTFATNCEITDMSFEQTGSAMNTGIALKTASNITNLNLHNISFFECKQAIKFPEQFYIARLTSLHAQGCTYGFELGREGTTLFLDNLFVTGGGGNADSFAYKVRASYTTIGSLACDDFNGQSYDFQYGQYDIGALGLELLHSKGAFGNISFYQTHFHIENIEIVNANNLTSTDLIMFAGDSSGSIGNIDTINTASVSPAQLFKSTNATIDIGGVSGTTTYAKSTYADQANAYGIELHGLRYQRGDMRPFLGLGNTNLPDQLTSHANPCKQSIIFDAYGAGFSYSGYAGGQDWRFLPAPSLGDWAIQRRPDLFGIAATVSLADGGVNNERTQAQSGVVPLVVFVKPTSPAEGCIYVNTAIGKVELFSGVSWLPLN